MSTYFTLGWTLTKDGKRNTSAFAIPRELLMKHLAVLGSSGSGKTVALKRVIEELALSGVPVIVLDINGDMSRLAIPDTEDALIRKRHAPSVGEEWSDKVEVRIFTPVSTHGIQVNCSPLRPLPPNINEEVAMQTIDMTTEALMAALQYKYSDDSMDYRVVKAFLYSVLDDARKNNCYPTSFEQLKVLVESYQGSPELQAAIKSRKVAILDNLMASMTGLEGAIYTMGVPLSVPLLTTPAEPGKTPISIIHLGALSTKEQKQQVAAVVGMLIYTHLLQTGNIGGNLKMAFVLDEVQDILPADPYQPISKRIISALFKQARKFGCAMLIATQNWGAVSYQLLNNANTIIMGRNMSEQDVEKTRSFLKSYFVATPQGLESVTASVRAMDPGEFWVVSPDEWSTPHRVKFLQTITDHGPPIPIERLDKLVPAYIRQYYDAMRGVVSTGRKGKKNGTFEVHTTLTDYKCSQCGCQLTWVEEYKRYWCGSERRYV